MSTQADLTVEEVAEKLQVTGRAVRYWITDGLLLATRVGRRKYLIKQRDFEAALKRGDIGEGG